MFLMTVEGMLSEPDHTGLLNRRLEAYQYIRRPGRQRQYLSRASTLQRGIFVTEGHGRGMGGDRPHWHASMPRRRPSGGSHSWELTHNDDGDVCMGGKGQGQV